MALPKPHSVPFHGSYLWKSPYEILSRSLTRAGDENAQKDKDMIVEEVTKEGITVW